MKGTVTISLKELTDLIESNKRLKKSVEDNNQYCVQIERITLNDYGDYYSYDLAYLYTSSEFIKDIIEGYKNQVHQLQIDLDNQRHKNYKLRNRGLISRILNIK